MDQGSVSGDFRATRVIRSSRRRKTVAARVQDGVLMIYLPARISAEEEKVWVERMTSRMSQRVIRSSLNDDRELQRRATLLNQKYFEGRLHYASIVFVTNQSSKYGSCSPGSGRIRIFFRDGVYPRFGEGLRPGAEAR